jgi:sugar phosphate isomerase/epimerase
MKPKFACSDFTFPLLKHNHVLTLISMLGFEGVDIGLFEGRSHLQPSTEFKAIKKNAKRLSQELERNHLVAADVFLQCNNDFSVYAINQPKKERRDLARDWYLKTLDYASNLNAHHVTILPGVAFGKDYEVDFALAAEELLWRVEKAKDYKITLGFEAHVGSLVQEPKKAQRLVKSVKGLTLTLDYTHFIRIGMKEKDYSILMPYASHFHARNAAPGQLQTIFKENKIDYRKVVKSMLETNYKGYVGIEFFWMEWENGNRVDNISETILLKNYIKECWNELSKA